MSSCKKDTVGGVDDEEIISPITGTRTEFTLDSIFLYAKQIYLWNDALPMYSNFEPRQKYANIKPELWAFKKEIFDISQLKLNQITGRPFEISMHSEVPKYSYLQLGRTSAGNGYAGIVFGEAILAKRIIQTEDKVIAYIALGSFPSLSNVKDKLNQVFDEMAVEKPKYLVLDLRSNGGGYVETAEYVANLIIPSKLTGKIMYSEQFNTTLQTGNAKILKYQPYLDEMGRSVIYKGRAATLADVDYSEKGNTYLFAKMGNLESIQEIYFIVSGQTASASELLISSLKPYFNIKLIGEKTYGKPVGFFGINIDQYSVYLSSFLIKNAQGWSDYFEGMEPDISKTTTSNLPLGDPEELCLKACISSIDKQTVQKKSVKSSIISTVKEQYHIISTLNPTVENFGILENRLKLKN